MRFLCRNKMLSFSSLRNIFVKYTKNKTKTFRCNHEEVRFYKLVTRYNAICIYFVYLQKVNIATKTTIQGDNGNSIYPEKLLNRYS